MLLRVMCVSECTGALEIDSERPAPEDKEVAPRRTVATAANVIAHPTHTAVLAVRPICHILAVGCGSRQADQVGRMGSPESHRWACNVERPLTRAQRAYSDLAVECQVTIPRCLSGRRGE